MIVRHLITSICIVAVASVVAADLHEHPAEERSARVFDKRRDTNRVAALDSTREASRSRLARHISALKVDFDDILASPKFVLNSEGFLSGPDDETTSNPPTAETIHLPRAAADPHRPVKRFLDENADLFGYDSRILTGARVTRDYVTEHNGMRTVVWQQEFRGIPVHEAVLYGNITKNGELVSLSSQMVPEAANAADAESLALLDALGPVPVPAEHAVAAAARSIGEDSSAETVVALEASPAVGERKRFTAPAIEGEAAASLVWLPMDRNKMRLCWDVVLAGRTQGDVYQVLIDANTGDSQVQVSRTANLTPASYRIFASDSPSPFTPGHASPSSAQPSFVPQILVPNYVALSTTASPNGWINDGVTKMIGNNVDAHLDLFNADPNYDDDLPLNDSHPQRPANANRVFDYVWNSSQPPMPTNQAQYPDGSPNQNAAVVNAFYWCNWMHDRLYDLGFTEAAGNFQQNNFGRGGSGNDAVLVDVQDGAHTNGNSLRNQNRMSSLPNDGLGFAPRMKLQLFNGPTNSPPEQERDAALAAETILHEYTHGMNMRLIGHGAGLNLGYITVFGLDEGFADFFSFASLSQSGDNLAGTYATGGYIARNWKYAPTSQAVTANYYYGNLLFPNSTDMTKNPLTFKDLDPAQGSQHSTIDQSPTYPADLNSSEHYFVNLYVKAQQLWCVTLLEVRSNLIGAHGFATGNDLAMRLAVDSMKLCPANPNFLQARDALLLADRVYSLGANQTRIWEAFAKRGMGFSAVAPGSQTTLGIIEKFDMPPASRAKWTYTTGNAIYSSPAIAPDGTIVFGSSDDKVYGLTPNGTTTPTVKWSYTSPAGAWNFDSSPAIAPDGTIYVGGNDWRLHALYPNGSPKWVRYLNGAVVSAPAVDKDGTVIVGVCDTTTSVVAYDSIGNQKWSIPTSNYFYSSPAIGSDGYVYLGSMDNKVYAFSVVNGASKPGWPYITGGSVYSSPAIGPDGTVYVSSFDGKVYALYPGGTKKWEFNTGMAVRSSAVLGPDGTVYVGSNDSKIYALDGATGQVKQGWPFTTGWEVWSSPCVGHDGTVFVGSNDGKVYALNPNGSLRWSFNTGGGVSSSVVLGRDGTAYVGSENGKLYALPTETFLNTAT